MSSNVGRCSDLFACLRHRLGGLLRWGRQTVEEEVGGAAGAARRSWVVPRWCWQMSPVVERSRHRHLPWSEPGSFSVWPRKSSRSIRGTRCLRMSVTFDLCFCIALFSLKFKVDAILSDWAKATLIHVFGTFGFVNVLNVFILTVWREKCPPPFTCATGLSSQWHAKHELLKTAPKCIFISGRTNAMIRWVLFYMRPFLCNTFTFFFIIFCVRLVVECLYSYD